MISRVLFLVGLLIIGEHTMALTLTSPAFTRGSSIPSLYTCDGENNSIPLRWEGAPSGTQSFVIIFEDPDVPHHLRPDGMWDHWVLFNIPSTVSSLPENVENLPEGTIQGVNTGKKLGYMGPCPPDKQHRYFAKVLALDTLLDLKEGSTKAEVLKACEGHILEQDSLMGVYNRPQNQN